MDKAGISEREAERHRARMARRKQVQDAEVAGKTVEKGEGAAGHRILACKACVAVYHSASAVAPNKQMSTASAVQ